MKIFLFLFLILPFQSGFAQSDTGFIRINFLYGSKPAKGFKTIEKRRFGGIKGGHVNIEMEGKCLDFGPTGNCHVFPNNRKPCGNFCIRRCVKWDTLHDKSAYIIVPVTQKQRESLEKIFTKYATRPPYDYAVFGHRCASASYQVLSDIGMVRKRSRTGNIVSNFYPKLLRKKLYKWAKQNNYYLKIMEGSNSRKWESDEGLF